MASNIAVKISLPIAPSIASARDRLLVQALHDDDDCVTAFAVEPAVESVEVPFVGSVTPRIGERLLRFEVGPQPRQVTAQSVGDALHATG